jgi:uncharacterized protein (TIGR02588 family)
MSAGSSASASRSPAAELAMALLGAALVLGTVGFLLYQALFTKAGPPVLLLEATTVVQSEHGFLVHVTVRNEGGQTVAGLEIEGTLSQDGKQVETSRATLDFVPAFSERRVGFFFREDPRAFTLTLLETNPPPQWLCPEDSSGLRGCRQPNPRSP